jgi:hypothetical protein
MVSVQILGLSGLKFGIDPCNTVGEVKAKIYRLGPMYVPPDFQTLVFAGAVIEDHQILADIGVAAQSTLHLVLKLRGSEDGFRNLCRLTSLETGMAVGDVITATFHEPYQQCRDTLDPVNGSPVIRVFGPFHAPTSEAIRIKYEAYPEVTGAAHYDAATQQATFTPNAPLTSGSVYAAKVNGEVVPKTFRTAGRTLAEDVEQGNAELGWVHQDAVSRFSSVIWAAASDEPVEQTGDDDHLCAVCLTNRKDTVLVPCGHYCLCAADAAQVNQCPLCREPIQLRQRVYA